MSATLGPGPTLTLGAAPAAAPVGVPRGESTSRAIVTFVVVVFIGFTMAGLGGLGGTVFAPAWSLSAAVVAFLLITRSPTAYLSFVLTLWMISPFVRRVLDFHHGFNPANLAIAAPVLASSVALLTAARFARELRGALHAPLVLVITAVVYGFLVGMLRNGFVPAFYSFLTWLSPAMIGLHVAVHWRRYPEFSRAFVRFLAVAIPLTAGYGLYQFVLLPAWDRQWMISSELASIGAPLPFALRIFGTMTMPGTFAVTMQVGLLILLSAKVRGRLPALVLAFIGLLLSRIRTAWLGFVIGILLQLITQPVRKLPKNWFTMLLVGSLALPIITLPRFREGIVDRLGSLASLSEDSSVRQRVQVSRAGYELILQYAEGAGLGATGNTTAATGRGLRTLENGIIEVFYLFGWPGGLLFFLGVGGMIVQSLRLADARFDQFANATRSGAAALLSSLLISEVFTGAGGTFLWVLMGFGVSAHAYNLASGRTAQARLARFR